VKLVCASDFHADWSTLGVSRFAEVEAAVAESVEVALDEKADCYLFAGDLSDPDTGGDTFRAIRLALATAARLARYNVRSIWVAGNHDVCEDGSGATTLSPLHAFMATEPLVAVAEQPCLVRLDETTAVLCLPFAAVSHGYDTAAMAAALWPSDPATRVVVVSHLMLPGIHPGSETTDMPRGREVLYPFEATARATLRLQGHYHQRQIYEAPAGPPIHIVGALARLTFGEQDHEPGYLVIDLD
jgi:DNA repair exonuclease SbcCD nuclease subunit